MAISQGRLEMTNLIGVIGNHGRVVKERPNVAGKDLTVSN